jgi:hypothetical protein
MTDHAAGIEAGLGETQREPEADLSLKDPAIEQNHEEEDSELNQEQQETWDMLLATMSPEQLWGLLSREGKPLKEASAQVGSTSSSAPPAVAPTPVLPAVTPTPSTSLPLSGNALQHFAQLAAPTQGSQPSPTQLPPQPTNSAVPVIPATNAQSSSSSASVDGMRELIGHVGTMSTAVASVVLEMAQRLDGGQVKRGAPSTQCRGSPWIIAEQKRGRIVHECTRARLVAGQQVPLFRLTPAFLEDRSVTETNSKIKEPLDLSVDLKLPGVREFSYATRMYAEQVATLDVPVAEKDKAPGDRIIAHLARHWAQLEESVNMDDTLEFKAAMQYDVNVRSRLRDSGALGYDIATFDRELFNKTLGKLQMEQLFQSFAATQPMVSASFFSVPERGRSALALSLPLPCAAQNRELESNSLGARVGLAPHMRMRQSGRVGLPVASRARVGLALQKSIGLSRTPHCIRGSSRTRFAQVAVRTGWSRSSRRA